MSKKIDCTVNQELRSVVKFLKARNMGACQMYQEITAVYDSAIDKLSVSRWYQKCNEGSENDRSGQPRTVMCELIQSIIDECIKSNQP